MSTRRLVNRSRASEAASPAPRRQPISSETSSRPQQAPQAELPPYEPPACPLSTEAQQKLIALYNAHASNKYKTHIKGAISAITAAAGDANERLTTRQDALKKQIEKRKRNAQADVDDKIPDSEKNEEMFTKQLEKKVPDITKKAEAAIIELIDFGDELSMQASIFRDLSETIASVPVPQPPASRRRRVHSGSGEESEEEDPELLVEDDENLSALALLKIAKDDYATRYNSRTKRSRYADHNDFKGFKGAVHAARNPGGGVLPPHSSTFFPEEDGGTDARSRRRRNNTTDNTNNEVEDSDDDVVIAGASVNLKCPLSARIMEHPYSNDQCNHSYEREYLIDYINQQGTLFRDPNRPDETEKKAKCVEVGCDAMFGLSNFHDDEVLRRYVKYAQREEKNRAQDEEDDDDEPRGTQSSRPEQIDDEDDDDAVDIDKVDRREETARIKRERAKGRGLGMAPSQSQRYGGQDTDEEMN